MSKKEAFLGCIMIIACFLLIGYLSGNVRNADPEITAFINDIIPENAKNIDRIKIEDGGYKVCWEIDGESDCFAPILTSPQYNKKIQSLEGVYISRKSLFRPLIGLYYGELSAFIPKNVKTTVPKDEVKKTLTYIMLEIGERIETKNKIQSTWSKGL